MGACIAGQRAEWNVGIGSTAHPAADLYEDCRAVAQLVGDAVQSAGYEKDGAPSLQEIIPPGSTVLLKPNWVHHRNSSGASMNCMVTHRAFIEAALDLVLACSPRIVTVCDAPIQDCDFDALVPPEWRRALQARARGQCEIRVVDFRRAIVRSRGLDSGVRRDQRPLDDYILFDLGVDSLLEPISQPQGRFRVTSYDPRRLAEAHRPGRHRYLIARAAVDADVVINLPKLKTHKKAGLTGALKNLVGLNGDKDFLPHHRLGGSGIGGDCYEGFSPGRLAIELLHDTANRRLDTPEYHWWRRAASAVTGLQARIGPSDVEGSWHGNDTVWRMSLDINRALIYGRSDASLADARQRTVYSLTDAIICGEGEGPLSSTPRPLGMVSFSSSSVFADLVHSALMHYDWRLIPIIREAFAPMRYPLTSAAVERCRVSHNGQLLALSDVAEQFGQPFLAPRGWSARLQPAFDRS